MGGIGDNSGSDFFNSKSGVGYNFYGVRPAVTLKANVKLTGTSASGWNLSY